MSENQYDIKNTLYEIKNYICGKTSIDTNGAPYFQSKHDSNPGFDLHLDGFAAGVPYTRGVRT